MKALQNILIFGVRFYCWVISPAKALVLGGPACCRFTPSCSQYALEALRGHGALGGSLLALRRLMRCHPWGECGHDPVPQCKSEIRIPKSEGIPKHEVRTATSRPEVMSAVCFRILDFEFPSDFDTRISDLSIPVAARGEADLK